MSLPIKYWPDNPTLSNYFYLFEKMGFGNNVANTAFVAALTTILVTLLSLLSGYAMSRYRFYGKTFIYVLMLATQMLPAVVLMIPLFQTMVKLHLINSLWSLVLICTCTNLPFCMVMSRVNWKRPPKWTAAPCWGRCSAS